MPTKQEVPSIIEFIKARLTEARTEGVNLFVGDEAWRLEDDWLTVTVAPGQEGQRASDYAELMTTIEKQLREKGDDNVILVPVLED